MPQQFTIGDLARRYGLNKHQINYALGSGGIEAAHRVGIFRMFTDEQLPLIEAELARIAKKHGKDPADELATVSA